MSTFYYIQNLLFNQTYAMAWKRLYQNILLLNCEKKTEIKLHKFIFVPDTNEVNNWTNAQSSPFHIVASYMWWYLSFFFSFLKISCFFLFKFSTEKSYNNMNYWNNQQFTKCAANKSMFSWVIFRLFVFLLLFLEIIDFIKQNHSMYLDGLLFQLTNKRIFDSKTKPNTIQPVITIHILFVLSCFSFHSFGITEKYFDSQTELDVHRLQVSSDFWSDCVRVCMWVCVCAWCVIMKVNARIDTAFARIIC